MAVPSVVGRGEDDMERRRALSDRAVDGQAAPPRATEVVEGMEQIK